MDIEYLYEFTVIAELGSFSRAAEVLCISQSALSKHILSLERELGVALLQRNSRSVSLTPAGAQVMPMAEEMSRLKDRIRAVAEAQNRREKRVLPIASIPVMAQYGIPGLLAGFRREHPETALEIMECERQELGELLERGSSELAFARYGLEDETGYEYLTIFRDNLVAVTARSHPLAGLSTVRLTDLREEPLLFLDQQTGFHHLYSALCRGAGFVPHIVYTGRRPENIMELAAQGMGVALVMRGHADYAANPEAAVLELTPRVDSAVCLLRRKGRPLSPMAQAFWDYVEEQISGAE